MVPCMLTSKRSWIQSIWSRGIQSKICYSCVFSSMWFFWHSPIHNQRGFLFSLPLPIISCFLSFNYVLVTSLCTWQPLELWFLSPPQHQSCYFKSMLSKHRHDGAWTLQDYRLPKGCWLHILHIIILISYTQLTVGFRLVCFVFWGTLENLKCIWFCCSHSTGFSSKYFVLGRELLHSQNLSLILNFSRCTDVQPCEYSLYPCLYACSFNCHPREKVAEISY